jgi:hypothetical protein
MFLKTNEFPTPSKGKATCGRQEYKNQSISPLSRLSWPTFPPPHKKSESCSTLMDSVSTTVSIDQLLNKLDFKGFHFTKMNYCR